jgi:hypothetical protein
MRGLFHAYTALQKVWTCPTLLQTCEDGSEKGGRTTPPAVPDILPPARRLVSLGSDIRALGVMWNPPVRCWSLGSARQRYVPTEGDTILILCLFQDGALAERDVKTDSISAKFVQLHSAAWSAGIRPGEKLVAVNGVAMGSHEPLCVGSSFGQGSGALSLPPHDRDDGCIIGF